VYPNGGIDGKCFVSHRLHIHFPVKQIKQQADEANHYHPMTLLYIEASFISRVRSCVMSMAGEKFVEAQLCTRYSVALGFLCGQCKYSH